MSAMLTAADVTDLRTEFVEAQEDFTLVLYRLNESTQAYDPITAQDVQIAYPQRTRPQSGQSQGAVASMADVTFYRESPFDVLVGDTFGLDGHKGGTITRVTTDPVLGVIAADAVLDVGVPS